MHRALAFLGLALAVLALSGMVARHRIGACLSFSALVAASVAFTGTFLLFPTWYTPEAFLIKQGIYDSLLFGMSLELSFRVFRAFRGIADSARRLLGAAVLTSTLIIFLLTPRYAEVWRYEPGITTAGIWCLTCVALLIVWYQIPVPSFTKAIVVGYVPYLMVFTVYVDLIGRLGWKAIPELNIANAAAYDGMAAYWAYAAWRKD